MTHEARPSPTATPPPKPRNLPRVNRRSCNSSPKASPNKQVAAELSISIKTVEKHRQQVMNKLNIHDVAGLTRYAIAKGWVENRARTAV